MKKFTFLTLLFAFSLNAQTYCPISELYEGIAEITSINFGTTAITNSNATSIYIDKISTVANVARGESYTITVKGKSVEGFDDEYAAYVDWNHNGTLNDEGEVFYIGLITNSTGYDSLSASTTITIPSAALSGNTRIRIMKVATMASQLYVYNYDPCFINVEDELYEDEVVASYGQGLDFTLNISTLHIDAFTKNSFMIYPNPASSILNVETNQQIDSVLVYNLQGQLVLESKNSDKIDVQSLASGQYLLKISYGQLFQVKKFVKN